MNQKSSIGINISKRRLFTVCMIMCMFALVIIAVSTTALAETEDLPKDLLRIDDDVVYTTPEDVHDPAEDDDYVFTPPADPRDIDNRALLLGWLMDNGYSLTSAAAIAGNLQSETRNINPLRLEAGVGNTQDYVADNFRAINNNDKKTYIGGFGICQWTSYTRVYNLQKYADLRELPVTSIEAQLRFLIIELAKYDMTPRYLNSLSLEEATFEIYRYYLTPGSSLWTTHFYEGRYRYFNSYSPTSYSEGRFPLSERHTPSAFRAFNLRLSLAEDFLDIVPIRNQFDLLYDDYSWLDPFEGFVAAEPRYFVTITMPIDEIRNDMASDEDLFDDVDEVDGIFTTNINSNDSKPDNNTGTSSPAQSQSQSEPIEEILEIPLLNLR